MKSRNRYYSSSADKGLIIQSVHLLGDLYTYRHVIFNMILQRLTRQYTASKFGSLWIVLGPAMTIVGIALLFPLLMRVKMENYVIYLFSGLLAWNFITASLNAGSGAIVQQAAFVKKVYLPKMIFPIVVTATAFVELIFVALVLHLIGLAFGMGINTNVLFLMLSFVVTALFCLGVASILSIVTTYIRDTQHLLSAAIRAFFFLTPIIYPVSTLPEKLAQYMEFNPFFQFVRLFHQAIYYSSEMSWGYFQGALILAGSFFIIGLIVQARFGDRVVYNL